MASASNHSTQAMTSQEMRDSEKRCNEEREKYIEQQEALMKSPDFLRIIPSNTKAKRAFSELIKRKKEGTLSQHHAQYIVDTGKGPLHKPIDYQARSDDETPDEDYPDEPEASEIVNLGFFKVSFDYENVTNSAKWVMGRGSGRKGGDTDKRNVDILLAAPNTKFTKGLLATHAFLRMHSASGVWMLQAARESTNRSGESAPVVMAMLDDHEIFNNGFRCLDKPELRLSILGMEYCVQFTLTTYTECDNYRLLRNRKIEDHDIRAPDTRISGIPLSSDIRAQGLAVFSLGLGSGNFGSVYEGFDPKTGDLRVVKVIELKRESASRSAKSEIAMVEQYPNARGLVRQYGWCNSNGELTLEAKEYPFSIYIVQRKGEVFHKHSWQAGPEMGMEILRLCEDLLHGLHTIHQAGWMHRDITTQNILYFKGDPAEAALCDFGKLHRGKTHTDTGIAAWNYLPPEIVQGASNTYNQSIDIWMLALALLISWYRPVFRNIQGRSANGQITVNNIGTIRARLAGFKNDGLAFLLRDMLSENPDERPDTKRALEYPCFRWLKPRVPQEAESSKGKRRHQEEDSIDIQAMKKQANRAE